jgi:hypothetical protein
VALKAQSTIDVGECTEAATVTLPDVAEGLGSWYLGPAPCLRHIEIRPVGKILRGDGEGRRTRPFGNQPLLIAIVQEKDVGLILHRADAGKVSGQIRRARAKTFRT